MKSSVVFVSVEIIKVNEIYVKDNAMSAAEAASRHRDIERIEEGGFHSSSFKSTAGGAGGRVKTEVTLPNNYHPFFISEPCSY